MFVLKEILRFILYFITRKNYKFKVKTGGNIISVSDRSDKEFFFGYYDHSPEKRGRVVYHIKRGKNVEIHVVDLNSKQDFHVGTSQAFNWQMGARALWIKDDIVSWNDFDGEKYICKWFSLKKKCVVKIFPLPLQDFSNSYFLTVNYQRLRTKALDYAYLCLDEMSRDLYMDYVHDGIWKYSFEKESIELLVSIQDVINCDSEDLTLFRLHFLNHIMINFSGNKFIFIHRFFNNRGVRFDRLFCYDFKKLKCLLKNGYQSHFCWLDNDNIFGYGEFNKQKGFYTINTINGRVYFHQKLTENHKKDGHPTKNGDWIAIDSYPDLSRMQHLILYNYKTEEIKPVLEVFHDLKHKGVERCDLHPRFSPDGRRIYIDTIFRGRRELAYLKIEDCGY